MSVAALTQPIVFSAVIMYLTIPFASPIVKKPTKINYYACHRKHERLVLGRTVSYTRAMVKKAPLSQTKKTENRVDYYPNRGALAIAALAAIILVILGFIAVYA